MCCCAIYRSMPFLYIKQAYSPRFICASSYYLHSKSVIPFPDRYDIRREAAGSTDVRHGIATTCRIDMEMKLHHQRSMCMNSLQHNRLDVGVGVVVHLCQKGLAHARVPKIFDVFGNACQGFRTVGHHLEKSANLVGHANQGVVVCHLESRE